MLFYRHAADWFRLRAPTTTCPGNCRARHLGGSAGAGRSKGSSFCGCTAAITAARPAEAGGGCGCATTAHSASILAKPLWDEVVEKKDGLDGIETEPFHPSL